MRTAPGLRRLFRFPFGRHQVAQDVEEELRFHIDQRAEQLAAAGMDPEAARREAVRRFGNLREVRRQCIATTGRRDRSLLRRTLLAEWVADVRYAARSLAAAPGFTAVALLTLALGLGATTGLFSVVDGILLSPLPFPEPERMVAVWADYTGRGGPRREWLSWPNARDLEAESGAFAAVALYDDWAPTLTGRGEPVQLTGAQISRGMLPVVLAVEPARGRAFTAAEARPHGPRAVLVSHGFWTRRLAADPEAVGASLTLDGEPHAVVGVMPEGFQPPFAPDAELWRPLEPGLGRLADVRGSAVLRAIGRLRPGVSLAAARTAAEGLARRLEIAYPEANTGVSYYLAPLKADLAVRVSTGLWTLLGAVALVLLIACFNVANLLLARASAREAELAVRSALGAGRGRIARQLLAESGLLALVGGGLGLALAFVLTGVLVALAPEGTPRIGEVAVDGRVLAFAAAAMAASVLLFGLLPALKAARADLRRALQGGGRGSAAADRGAALRSALVMAQVAVALMLLVGAGLLLRSFQALAGVGPGFTPEGLLTARVLLPDSRYPDAGTVRELLQRLEERLGALPGVEAVGSVSSLPLTGPNEDVNFVIEGRPAPPPGEGAAAWIRRATPGYFATLGIPVVAGRSFDAGDHSEAPPVVLVNQTLARRYFAGTSPVGRRINFNGPSSPVWREIVGVARDVKAFGLAAESRDAVYFPFAQVPARFMAVALKAAGEPEALLPAVRRVVSDLDPELAVADAATMESRVRGSLATERFVTVLLTLFAALAVVLSLVGLYGLVSYRVSCRVRELGVRMALGAGGADIRRRVVGGSLALVAAGLALGLAGALALTRLLRGLLFGVSATDPLTFAATALLLAAAAVAASLPPAQRAARVDPVIVLKGE